jgi:uncharacterized protein (DUF58 family)
VVVLVLAVGMAWLSGPRALNALAAPILVALGAAVVQLHRAGAPTVERSEPRRGFPGEVRTIELRVEGTGVATVADGLSAGVEGDPTGDGTLPTTVTYEVTLTERGEATLGPAAVRIRDALGLLETVHAVGGRTSLLVYPRVSVVDAVAFGPQAAGPPTGDRAEFDRLREYVPGDRLRDVNWKSTAKYDELLVTDYTDPGQDSALHVAAGAEPARADAMADATASLAVGALRAGIPVALDVPEKSLEAGVDAAHRRRILAVLARAGPGDVAGQEAADVVVTATHDGVTVTTRDRTRSMEELTLRGENPLLAREGVA